MLLFLKHSLNLDYNNEFRGCFSQVRDGKQPERTSFCAEDSRESVTSRWQFYLWMCGVGVCYLWIWSPRRSHRRIQVRKTWQNPTSTFNFVWQFISLIDFGI